MHWSLRNTMLAIILPLTIAILAMSAAQIADLVAVRKNIEGFRDSAFRSIYAERYASSVQVLLKVSVDQLAAGGEGLEAIGSAHARTADALERLRPLVHEGASADGIVSGLTVTTLGEWERTQEQIDIYIARAADLARKGKVAEARRLLVDELEVLVDSRIFSSIDLVAQREQELFEEYRARVMRATQHWLARHAGSMDLRERLLADFYEAILAERLARQACAEFSSFTNHVLEGRPLDESHGIAASQSIAQLSQLQRARAKDGGAEGKDEVAGLAESYARIRDAYERTLALPPASRSSNGRSVVRRLGETFDQSLLPRANAIVRAHEQSIEREMARLDHWAQGIQSLTIGVAVIALLLGLGGPFLASRLMVKPVIDLVDTLSCFRSGSKDARPSLRPRNELGLLASSLHGLLDELQHADQKVRALAFYDSTTGLPNRQLFQERLAGGLVRARLHGYVMGLLSVKLSGLKQVNETLGIDAGDDLMRQAAKRLRECLRLSDILSHPSGEEWKTEVSRLEGDEFTILLTKISKATDAAFVAQRVLSQLSEPFEVEDRKIVVIMSIGIGVYPQDASDAETLLRNAAAAMTEAKRLGGNIYQFYSEAMNVANSRKLHIRGRLSGAMERNDLALYYQPILNAQHGGIVGAEALLRWTDSEMGPIGPDEFMPIAEHSGLISQIGRWVLSTACNQLRAWQDGCYPEIRMSVNVSAIELRDEDWADSVAETLRQSGVSPGCLELEITETTIIHVVPKMITALTKVAEMGVNIVLDDFGTGYSSFSNLRSLPIRRVKVDRSFVSEIMEDGKGGALAGAIVTLGCSLGLGVVAEGVETQDQADFLRSSGCHELQGYLISRPLPAAEFEGLMARQKPE